MRAGQQPWLTGDSSCQADSLPRPDDALGKFSMLKQLQLVAAACQTGSTSSGAAHLKPLHAADLLCTQCVWVWMGVGEWGRGGGWVGVGGGGT